MNNIKLAAAFPYLIFKAKFFWNKSNKSKIPGFKFNTFGRNIARKLLAKGDFSPKLFLNPVSIVRYFEFDFVE